MKLHESPDTPSGPLAFVWIVNEGSQFGLPSITKYRLHSVGKNSGVNVWEYGSRKYIPKATGREFLYDQDEAMKAAERIMESRLKKHDKAAEKLRKTLDYGGLRITEAQTERPPKAKIEL